MRVLQLSIVLAGLLLFMNSCEHHVFCEQGSNNVTTEIRNVSNFTTINLEYSADVYVTQGPSYEVRVVASDNIQNYIRTEREGDELHIYAVHHHCIDDDVLVFVTMPDVEKLKISASGTITATGLISSSSLKTVIDGSGTIELDSLAVNEITNKITGSGKITLASIDTVYSQQVNIYGSGQIRSLNMPALNAHVEIVGSGNCNLQAIDVLDVEISGSGKVRYLGNPAISSSIIGSGKVEPYQ